MSYPEVESWLLPEHDSKAERAANYVVSAFKVLRQDRGNATKLESLQRCTETLRTEGYMFVHEDENYRIIPVDTVMKDGSVTGPYKPDLRAETPLQSYKGPPVFLKDLTTIAVYWDGRSKRSTCRSLDSGTAS